MNIGGCSTLLFSIGLVTLVACCLQLILFAKVLREYNPSDSNAEHVIPRAMVTPTTVARMTIAVGSISLLATAVFAFLDLAGMIVLRSRMWRQIADMHGLGWRSPMAKAANLDSARGLQPGKPCRYKMMSRHPVSWWQRWAFVEELVFSVQRNIAIIRLAISAAMAVAWSVVVVQMAVASLTGSCRLVVKGSRLVDSPARTLQLCDLLRKGIIATMVVWAGWTLLAVLLIFLNTRSNSSRPQLINYDMSGIPLNIIDYGPPVMRQPPGTASGHSKQATGPASGSGPLHYYYNPGPYMPPQKQAQFQRHGSVLGQQKRMANKPVRSSWSQLDEDSILSDPMRTDSQSVLQSQSKAHLFMPSQTMLQQFYHMQNQQLQGVHPYMPPTRISEEQAARQHSTASAKPARKRVHSVLHKSEASSVSTIPEPLVPDMGMVGDSRYRTSYTGEVNERIGQREQMRSREEQGVQRRATARGSNQGHGTGSRGPGATCAFGTSDSSRSLASLRYDIAAADVSQGGSSNSKRNTIG
ncbi:hypothetical protein IW139_004766 [Coemansia sp. RSA 353]|nr:hypothetical protein LPJ58_000370 [Coemansia sp. RSA 1591]KAJ1767685.1 hypothetical protein LPJ69_000366 [Coemansia sp. RSA 1752]KAJ1794989.1 hypothetical protein LPJ67_000349 [Coemansia sp. RSA 1938]KAJ2131232.1 hypothetical protein GGH17_003556 [Coemansia sp. RSA 788]KAJ2143023.1 hypothetical protein IW142_003968 [Coemansia sp. RSA 564]KAJ2161426.1 hypothetical protein GGH15_004793 [Coemansia sp. RSA 562]KAJ2212517.1 hypothetical protein IW143_003899 [Coemansia sp. RSA 520]KAJ2267852.1 